MRDVRQFSHFVASKSTFSYEFSLEPENLLPQNRCFVRGFRQLSAPLTKCHACHGICTLSPLDTALPMHFTKNTQHDTSKVLRLPRKMTMDTSKVLRLPRTMQHIFWKRRKSIAPATQNDFRHVTEHVWMSRSATPATRNEATRRLKPPKRTTSVKLPIGTAIRSSRERLRTVADGCARERNVERTHPHSGKRQIYIQGSRNWSTSQVYLILWFQGCATASTSSSSQPLQARNVDSPWWLKRCWSLLFWAWYWINYNDLTATSLESWLVREIIPKWP